MYLIMHGNFRNFDFTNDWYCCTKLLRELVKTEDFKIVKFSRCN